MVRKIVLLALMVLTVAVSAGAWAQVVPGNTTAAVELCQTVSTVATVLAASSGTGRRVKWSIVTTSGAATIYFKKGSGATVQGTDSLPLTGGQSYTDDGPNIYSGIVTAVAKTGSVWVCTDRTGN